MLKNERPQHLGWQPIKPRPKTFSVDAGKKRQLDTADAIYGEYYLSALRCIRSSSCPDLPTVGLDASPSDQLGILRAEV